MTRDTATVHEYRGVTALAVRPDQRADQVEAVWRAVGDFGVS
jgi:hypothetical protein